ncbi:MAG: Gfo/Idh/MocA family oxidoreductase [Kiritimatiellae bacterium]|nr:Gfo/Idh/MocA family oxidoreductase [Kiritimatiellia bacterium]
MNRRDFIKTSAGTFFIAAGGNAFGQHAASNRVRLAVIGCHEKGRGFGVMQNAVKVPGVEIAVVCDVDSRALIAAAAKIKALTGVEPRKEKDVRRVLAMKDVDGILCETPDHWHAWCAWEAMKAGKAVYVEKPCSFCQRESEILLTTQRATNGIFQMGNQRRSDSNALAAIKAIREGAIGEPRWGKAWYMAARPPIGRGKPVAVPEWLDWDLWQGPAPRTGFHDNYVHYNWHWFLRWGTGENGNNAPHFTDLVRLALGEDGYPRRTTAGGGRFFYDNDDWEWPDSVNATWEFADRKFITWECLSCVRNNPYMNCGTGGMVYGLEGAVLFRPNCTSALYDAKGALVREWKGVSVDAGSDLSKTMSFGSMDVAHLARFAECIRARDTRTASPVEEAVKSVSMTHFANMAQLGGGDVIADAKTGALVSASPEAARFWNREYAPGWEVS